MRHLRFWCVVRISSRRTTLASVIAEKELTVHTHARFASLFGGLKGLVILLALALLATPIQASTIVFFDNFQSDTVGSTPVIGSGDIGLSWSHEVAPGVEVASNPDMTGNTSSQVLQLWNKGEMDGNFSTGILFDGATLSTDFYISSDSASNKITMKFRTAAGWGPFNLNLKQNGDVTGGLAVGPLAINHYGSDVWQTATWSFSYTGTGNFWDVDLAFTNLDTPATHSGSFNVELAGLTASDVFTEVTPRGQSTGSMYVDNIQVSTVPEPSTGLLLTLGLTALSFRRRRTARP